MTRYLVNIFYMYQDKETVADEVDLKPESNDEEIKGKKCEIVNKESLLSYGMTSGVLVEGDGALVTEDVMSTWLQNVWFRHVPTTNFLLADSYHVHTAQSTQKILLEVEIIKDEFLRSDYNLRQQIWQSLLN